jgi:hypothetical protein
LLQRLLEAVSTAADATAGMNEQLQKGTAETAQAREELLGAVKQAREQLEAAGAAAGAGAVVAAVQEALRGAGEASAAEAQLLNAAEEKQQLLAVVESLQGLRADMGVLLSEQRQVQRGLGQLQQEVRRNSNMLQSLLSGKHKVPLLLLVLPHERSTGFGRVKGMFMTKMQLCFVCPLTLQRGTPYVTTVPRAWLVNAMPVIKFSLLVLQVALTVAGLPVPALGLVQKGLSSAVAGVGLATTAVGAVFDKEAARQVLEDLDGQLTGMCNELTAVGVGAGGSGVGSLTLDLALALDPSQHQQQLQQLKQGCEEGYRATYDLLRGLEKGSGGGTLDSEWRPQLTGLEEVTSRADGSSAWVLADQAVKNWFHEVGAEALKF